MLLACAALSEEQFENAGGALKQYRRGKSNSFLSWSTREQSLLKTLRQPATVSLRGPSFKHINQGNSMAKDNAGKRDSAV